ncbi:MAG: PhzF family phenazine biosynthesis protein [Anaerolineales bacterium]|nr:PhzF family phenazine biosynthesis protein [Anaerolineales bacterium]MCB8939921.1 PhzF family phenazine biosynthesis protein [Ardenticatenaceae bacterium]
MPTYPFMQVDAFTERPLAGNPCAIIFNADDLTADQMLAIAKEMNLSETAFVLKSEIADVRARYFTPAEEIPLAGHPTIATMHALVETGQIKLQGDYTKISLELQVGPIPIELYQTGGGVRIVMNQKKPQFLATLSPDEVMPHFGLTAADCLPDAKPQIVSTGTPQLMIPVRNLEALRRAQLNAATYPAFRQSAGFFSPHLFCLQGATNQGDTFARHFGVPPDTMEDPFTGSATGGMAAYLWHHRLLSHPTFIAEQGHWMNRPGQAQVEVVGPPDEIETVKVGGTAVTVMTGQLTI